MKRKNNKLVIYSIIGIVFLFLLSMLVPSLQVVSKVGALLIYIGVSYKQLLDMKKQGENIEKSIMFLIAVVLVLGYLLFFT